LGLDRTMMPDSEDLIDPDSDEYDDPDAWVDEDDN
jgi:hypothetical protein